MKPNLNVRKLNLTNLKAEIDFCFRLSAFWFLP